MRIWEMEPARERLMHGLDQEAEPGKIPPVTHTVSTCAVCRQDRQGIAQAVLRLLIAGRGTPPISR